MDLCELISFVVRWGFGSDFCVFDEEIFDF